jgi:putative acetyltransferase
MHHTYRDFTIRPWQPPDRSAAAEVISAVLAEYGLVWEPTGTDSDAVLVEQFYHNNGGEFWVIEVSQPVAEAGSRSADQTEVVGTGGYYPCGRSQHSVEIRKMYLKPEVRGQGLGRYILGSLEQAIAAKGFHTIWIETASVLKEAIRLYETSGYEPVTDLQPCVSRCDRLYRKTLIAPQHDPR